MVEEQKYFDYLSIPGWDDIVHIQPPPTIMEWEMEEHRKRRRRHEPSNLTQRQLDLLKKKRERYLRMKASPAPEIVKCISKIMTDYDDLQDGILTAACFARLLPRLMPRIMGRFVPVVGWLMLASDTINLFNILTWMPFFGMSAKRTKEQLTALNPLGRKAKLLRIKRINRVVPTFREFLQIAQTTDQLGGVGLCLGGVVGHVVDCLSGFFKGLTSPIKPRMMTEFARGFFATQKATLTTNVCHQELTDEEHTAGYVSAYLGQQYLKPLLDNFDWFSLAEIYSHIPIKAHASMSCSTRYILEEEGEDIEETMRWPIPGTPKEVTLAEYVEKAFPSIHKSIHDYYMRMRKTYEGYIGSHCLHEYLYDSLLMWEGHNPYSTEFYRREEDVEYSITLHDGGSPLGNPSAYDYSQGEKNRMNEGILEKSETEIERITSVMLENEILPQPDTTPEQLKYFFDRCVAGDRMAQAESGPREIFDQYVQDIGWPRRAFPIFPKNASHQFIKNQEEMSEMFRENLFYRCKDLWPRWELMPREAIDFYLQYGLL